MTNVGLPHDIYTSNNRFVKQDELALVRTRALQNTNPFSIVDEDVDMQWARYHTDSKAPKSYYDYYFAGPDMKVYIAELSDDPEFGDLPMAFFGFRVSQEKTPVYGFWNYSYSAVMRGVRIIEGEFAIAPPYPSYMRAALAAAANKRVENYGQLRDYYPGFRAISEDDRNIDKYWGRHLDAATNNQGMNEYSIHPPFNFVIVFGVQNTSVEVNGESNMEMYSSDAALYHDHNQRLVEGFNESQPTRYILEACELKSMETQYGASGEVVYERYSFFARDIITPPANYSPQNIVQTPPIEIPHGVDREDV